MENLSLFDVENNEGLAGAKTTYHSNTAPVAEKKLSTQSLCSILVNQNLRAPDDLHKDTHAKLVQTLQSPAVHALLQAAEQFSLDSGLPAQEALTKIVQDLQMLGELWKQILLQEGLARLNSQLH